MPHKYIGYETFEDGRIARITLNRVGARNAQNRGLLVELDEAFVRAEQDDAVRVVILAGAGPMFSSGHDLGSKEDIAERKPGPDLHPSFTINGASRKGAESRMLQEWHYFFQNTLRWRNLRKITIAQVHGNVYAAGLMLMWCCDLIVSGRQHDFRRRCWHPARDVWAGVLRTPMGVRATQSEGAAPDRRFARRRGSTFARDGVENLSGR